jgi:hypothetical protein
MIAVKLKVYQEDTNNFSGEVNGVLDALKEKCRISLHGFPITPIKASLEGAVPSLILNVEGYIK